MSKHIKALVVLNLQSYAGGRDLWGLRDPKRDAAKGWQTPIFNDGLIEVRSTPICTAPRMLAGQFTSLGKGSQPRAARCPLSVAIEGGHMRACLTRSMLACLDSCTDESPPSRGWQQPTCGIETGLALLLGLLWQHQVVGVL